MAANLSPEYFEAERKYKSAQNPAEKAAALEEMLSAIPKHKGTEKMQADIKSRLAKLRAQAQAQKKGGPAHAQPFYQIDREGCGQLALVGAPNTGKSALLRALTHATPEVADYPFTTRLPTPGMMAYEDVQFQLVDLPPISPEFTEYWLPVLIRQTDGILLVVDLAALDLLDEIDDTRRLLEERRIPLEKSRTLLVANKLDLPGADGNFDALQDLFGEQWKMLAVSTATGAGLDQLRRAVFDLMDVVRVYTKTPGHKLQRSAPYVLKRGTTAMQVAEHVHKEIAQHLKYARIWADGRYEGQMVDRHHLVQDGDVIEFHTA